MQTTFAEEILAIDMYPRPSDNMLIFQKQKHISAKI